MSDGFNLTHTGEHQFQFLDVTSSISPDDATPHAVTGAAHYYTSLPPPPMYVIIDHSGGIYPATVGAGTPLSTSGYVAPVAPLMTPQMQSGVVLPPGVIPAAAAPTLLRPRLIQQPQPASVIMPAPTGILPPTSIIPSHGTIRPLPRSVAEIPVPAVSELTLNASAGYSGQPLIAGANRFDDLPFSSMPVDMHTDTRLAHDDGLYIDSGACNMNNSAAEHVLSARSDTEHPSSEHSATELVGSLDRDDETDVANPFAAEFEYPLDRVVSGQGNGLATYKECTGNDGGAEFHDGSMVLDSQPEVTPVNGELSVDASHELGSLSETSSVTSPSSLMTDMTLNDSASERDVCVVSAMTDHGHSPVMNTSSTPQSSPTPATAPSPSTAVKTKAPSWASLLKDTTSATNAIVISMNDNRAAATQQKADVKAVTKEPVAPQSAILLVSNDEKLKLEISGLYAAVSALGFSRSQMYTNDPF